MSIIEQIRVEESRLKEVLGLKNIIFNPYGPGWPGPAHRQAAAAAGQPRGAQAL